MISELAAQTQAVVTHHMQALLTLDFKEVMLDYTENSVLILPQITLKGPEAIRGFFTSNPPELITAIKMGRTDVQGEIAYGLWTAEPYFRMGSDTFLVKDGKIAVQTVAYYPYTKE